MTYPQNEIVVLLHGIGHSRFNLLGLEKGFSRAGYDVLNLSYPSRRYKIKELADWLADRLEREGVWNGYKKVHYAGHSMGGLVIQYYLEGFKPLIKPEKTGRVVMLGTPHGGSEVADVLHKTWLYRVVFGPAGQELTTCERRAVRDDIRPFYDLGIIAGTRGWLYPAGMMAIRGVHDGCVAVESTKRTDMTDHITLPVLHGFMGWDGNTVRQAVHFIKKGKFAR